MIELSLADIERLVPNIETVGIDEKVVAYRFTGGIYKGVSYTYADIRFNVVDVEAGNKLTEYRPEDIDPDDERYALEVAFQYVILENTEKKDIDAKAFKDYIGSILVTVINGSIDNGK